MDTSQRGGNVRRERSQQLHELKVGRHRGIEDLLNCAPRLLFFISMKLKVFRVTHNDTPKMVKMSASTNNFSQIFADYVYLSLQRRATCTTKPTGESAILISLKITSASQKSMAYQHPWSLKWTAKIQTIILYPTKNVVTPCPPSRLKTKGRGPLTKSKYMFHSENTCFGKIYNH